MVPPLADGFSGRPETEPGVRAQLIPGAIVALVPQQPPGDEAGEWLEPCGKTQLAVFLAESLWRSRKIDLLVWINATSRAAVLAGLVEAATAVMGTAAAGDAELVAARFVSWLGETTRPWMMVLDDLADVADLAGLWPAGLTGRVLITSRNPAVVGSDLALVLPVGVLSSREALSYLMGRLTVDPDQRLGAIDLVEDLGCEPLALAQASAVIASSALSCREYREYFASRRDRHAAHGKPAAAAVTWALSVEQTERLQPGGAAQLLLAVASLLDGHGIPGALFTTAATGKYLAGAGRPADPKSAWDALVALMRAGLLAIDPNDPSRTVRVNAVVQSAVRRAMPAGMFQQAARAAADALLEIWPADEPRPWHAAGLRSCAASLQWAAGDLLWGDGCHPLLLRAGHSLDAAGLAGPAVGYWRQLAALCDRILGPAHPGTLAVRDQLARSYLAAGRAADAVPLFHWVLSGRARSREPDPAEVIATQINLGRALVAAGQPGEAVGVLGEAVSECERAYGTDHPASLNARDEYAAACLAAGKPADAIRLYRRTLGDRERVQGPRHSDTVSTRQRLADAFMAKGRVKDAISQHKRALSDLERVLGPDHADTIAARSNLAAVSHAAGRMAVAVQLYEQTRADCERVLGTNHPDTLARRTSLAHAYYAVGRLTDARALLTDTLARCERVLPRDDPLTRAARESLANITGG
jgi:tetratricopeptide (TPR) repeat protein